MSTPRTQAVINRIADEGCTNIQPLFDLSRTLERDLAAARAESEEQARLLGMSGERECDLRGKVRKLERENAALREKVDDWENAALHALDHRPDEQHCTCVAPLIGKVKQLQRELDSAKERLRTEATDDYSAIKELEREVERLRRELEVMRESYAYAEISLPTELIPARKEATK